MNYGVNIEAKNQRILNNITRFDYPKNPQFKDLSGQTFGKLYVERFLGQHINKKSYTNYYVCKCECGNIVYVDGAHLTRGLTTSCGCYHARMVSKYGKEHVKHGGFGTRLYRKYNGIKARCFNKNYHAFPDYGGRGITMCEEWANLDNGFENFRNWAYENGYSDYYEQHREVYISIDRINPDGNYEPNNCRFVTSAKVQANNKQNTIYLQLDRFVLPMTVWSEITKIPLATLYSRKCEHNWSDKDCLCTPSNNENQFIASIIAIPPKYEIYNKYDEWVKKGKIKPVEETIYKDCPYIEHK